MKYSFIVSENFKKEFKTLFKKFPSLKKELEDLQKNIETELELADDLGNGFRKIRLSIKSKGKGSRGGARIITHETIIAIDKTNIVLGSIYDKSEFSTIDIAILKKNLGIK